MSVSHVIKFTKEARSAWIDSHNQGMAERLRRPWILERVVNSLKTANQSTIPVEKPKLCQIFGYDSYQFPVILWLSDSENKITARLSDECLEEFERQYRKKVTSVKAAIVGLIGVSLCIESRGDGKICPTFSIEQLKLLGGEKEALFGEPTDIAEHPEVTNLLQSEALKELCVDKRAHMRRLEGLIDKLPFREEDKGENQTLSSSSESTNFKTQQTVSSDPEASVSQGVQERPAGPTGTMRPPHPGWKGMTDITNEDIEISEEQARQLNSEQCWMTVRKVDGKILCQFLDGYEEPVEIAADETPSVDPASRQDEEEAVAPVVSPIISPVIPPVAEQSENPPSLSDEAISWPASPPENQETRDAAQVAEKDTKSPTSRTASTEPLNEPGKPKPSATPLESLEQPVERAKDSPAGKTISESKDGGATPEDFLNEIPPLSSQDAEMQTGPPPPITESKPNTQENNKPQSQPFSSSALTSEIQIARTPEAKVAKSAKPLSSMAGQEERTESGKQTDDADYEEGQIGTQSEIAVPSQKDDIAPEHPPVPDSEQRPKTDLDDEYNTKRDQPHTRQDGTKTSKLQETRSTLDRSKRNGSRKDIDVERIEDLVQLARRRIPRVRLECAIWVAEVGSAHSVYKLHRARYLDTARKRKFTEAMEPQYERSKKGRMSFSREASVLSNGAADSDDATRPSSPRGGLDRRPKSSGSPQTEAVTARPAEAPVYHATKMPTAQQNGEKASEEGSTARPKAEEGGEEQPDTGSEALSPATDGSQEVGNEDLTETDSLEPEPKPSLNPLSQAMVDAFQPSRPRARVDFLDWKHLVRGSKGK